MALRPLLNSKPEGKSSVGLESRYGSLAHREFKSLPLRHRFLGLPAPNAPVRSVNSIGFQLTVEASPKAVAWAPGRVVLLSEPALQIRGSCQPSPRPATTTQQPPRSIRRALRLPHAGRGLGWRRREPGTVRFLRAQHVLGLLRG